MASGRILLKMERDNFDTELFIDEIEKRGAIWDMESSDYSNRAIKRSNWEEIVEIFCESDDSEEKKKTLGKLRIVYLIILFLRLQIYRYFITISFYLAKGVCLR